MLDLKDLHQLVFECSFNCDWVEQGESIQLQHEFGVMRRYESNRAFVLLSFRNQLVYSRKHSFFSQPVHLRGV
jgi:hypothetical protein